MKIIIIDDDEIAIKHIVKLLGNFISFNIKISGTATSLDGGIKLIYTTQPDIVFLDINMPEKKGMDIYNEFVSPNFKIIFVTAYPEFAIEAFKKSAFYYLLKPLSIIDLQDALQKVSTELLHEQQQYELENNIHSLCPPNIQGTNIMFEVSNGFIMENTKNIEYCYANQSYSVIVTYLQKEILVSKSLKELQNLLPENQFYRTHKSYLVNIYYIRKFVHLKENYVLLKSGARIPVSIRVSSVIAKDISRMLSTLYQPQI